MAFARCVLLLTIAVTAGAATACAGAAVQGPEALAQLERAHTANPSSAPILRSLGIAYYKSGKMPEARRALDQAIRLEPRDGTAALYLGLTAEAQNDLSAARAAYGSYVKHGRTTRVRHALEARLAALQRREIEQTARMQVRDEQRLASVTGTPNVVAVMPLTFSGADTSLKPLERGFAELLSIDLARSSQLTVVERLRIQAVLDELRLQQTSATDSGSNVRAGRILQAGRMVQGAILQSGQQLRVDAAVVEVPTSRIAGSTNDDQQLEQLLTLEKNIALGLFQQLGITLTTAERNAIEQRPTRSLAAFLAYSRGLLLEDEGRFDDASRSFQEAMRLDPGFAAAQQRNQEAQNIVAGQQVTSAAIEAGLTGTAEGRIVERATTGVAVAGATESGTAMITAADLNPSSIGAAAANVAGTLTSPPLRDPVAAGIGLENPGQSTARIEIIVRRP